jgi:hypothetical protein
MDLVTWMWVWDDRLLLSLKHTHLRLCIAFAIPLILTFTFIITILTDKALTDELRYQLIPVISFTIAKIYCMIVLLWRQLKGK